MDQKDFQWNPWSEKREEKMKLSKKEMSKDVEGIHKPRGQLRGRGWDKWPLYYTNFIS